MANPEENTRLARRVRIAARISNAYGLALLLTLVTFFVMSWLPQEEWSRIIAVLLVAVTSIVGLASSGISHPHLHGAYVASLISAGLVALAVVLDSHALMAAGMLVTAILLLITAGTILTRVLLAPTVTFRTILGALTTYTMLGMLFGFAYLAIDQLQSGPFFAGASSSDGEFLFFSYTTLTTTGYGNLVPAGQPGESLAVLEMLTGQIFLVTLVAGLVSLWRPGRRTDADGKPRITLD